jgi:hypothetical protein
LFVYTFLVNSLIPVNLNPSNIGTTILKENLNIQLENSENKTVNFIIPKDKISIKIINYGVFNKFARHNYIMHHDVLGKILKVLQYINDNTTDKTIKKLIEYLRNKNTYKLKAIDVLFNIINKMYITSYENNTQNQNIIIKQDNKILSKTQYSNKIECLEEDDIQRLYEEQKIPKSFVKNYNNINNFPYLEISCKLKDVIIKEIIYQWNKLPRSDKLNYIN